MAANITRKNLLKMGSLLAAGLLLTGCSEGQDSKYQFDFLGSEEFGDGTTYHIHVRGAKLDGASEQSLTLTIDELSAFEISGRYTYEEGKGYKLYFDDAGSQFSYTSYDPESQELSFRYKLDMGEALGARSIVFSYKDAAFGKTYDGVGLGPTPPTFEGGGWGGYLGQFEISPAVLRCYEDGTANFTATAVTAVDPKTGTWDYDEESDTYHFVFPPQTFSNSEQVEPQEDGSVGYKTIHGEGDVRFDRSSDTTPTDFYAPYNAETGLYELDLDIVWYVYSVIHMTSPK